MPNGVPVATVALNAAKNAGILAAQILATNNDTIATTLSKYKLQMENEVLEMAKNI